MVLLVSSSGLATTASIAQQRSAFISAQKALRQHNYPQFALLKSQLLDYPLYPYLVYAELIQQLKYADEPAVQQFLEQYADTPLAAKLRNQWLYMLAGHHRWNDYLNYYQPSADISLHCYRRQALLNTDQSEAAFSQITKLWLTGHTLPDTCNEVLNAWQTAEDLSTDLIWERMRLAIQNKDSALVNSLATMLPKTLKPLIKQWQKIYLKPQLLAKPHFLKIDSHFSAYIAVQSLIKLAEKQPILAVALWQKIAHLNYIKPEYRAQITRAIALSMASNGLPQAANWLSLVATPDLTVRKWQIRLALAQENWPQVLQYINLLPKSERALPAWQYWLARCYEESGQQEIAIKIFQTLANKDNFYSILANACMTKPLQLASKKHSLSKQQLSNIEQLPGIQRSYELYQLAMQTESREEWRFTLRTLPPLEKHAAADLASQWGWYDRAFAAAPSDNLALRFPLAYRDQVLLQAKTQGIDPAWVFAVIRQESAFMPAARSRVGAAGLMQLMPGTAQDIAKQLKERLFQLHQILDISLNIRFGSHYLQQLFHSYKGNIVLATASYNAGPGRVRKWLELRPHLMTDAWIETIPWKETRNYVKNVITFQAIYQMHLQEASDLQALKQVIMQ